MADTGEADWREPDTTPEFREFVARKLSEMLDNTICEKDRSGHLVRAREAAAGQAPTGVRLFCDGPILEIPDSPPPPQPADEPPRKRPKLAGVDLQKYQLKRKSRLKSGFPAAAPASAAESSGVDGARGGLENGEDAGSGSDDDSDGEMARVAEAVVPAKFMSELATSKTVKLD